jgi:hypothetical protein
MLFEHATELTERKIFNNPGGTVFAVHYYSSVNAQQVMHPNSTLYQIYHDSCIICNLPTTSSDSATASASTSASVAVTDTTADLPYTLLQLAEENAAATGKPDINTTSATTSTSGLDLWSNQTSTYAPQTSLVQWTNLTSMSFYGGALKSGYRNQMQVSSASI